MQIINGKFLVYQTTINISYQYSKLQSFTHKLIFFLLPNPILFPQKAWIHNEATERNYVLLCSVDLPPEETRVHWTSATHYFVIKDRKPKSHSSMRIEIHEVIIRCESLDDRRKKRDLTMIFAACSPLLPDVCSFHKFH